MTKAIFFDIGNVLIYFSYEQLIIQLSEISGISPVKIWNEIEIMGPLYEEGRITTQALFEHFSQLAPKSFTQEAFTFAISNIFRPNPAILPIIEALKKQKVPLILISNTCEAHFNFLKEIFPIFTLFDHSILSHEIKARKPSQAIYEAAILAAGCTAEECFYTDDIADYVIAARSLGIDAETFVDAATLETHLSMRKLI